MLKITFMAVSLALALSTGHALAQDHDAHQGHMMSSVEDSPSSKAFAEANA